MAGRACCGSRARMRVARAGMRAPSAPAREIRSATPGTVVAPDIALRTTHGFELVVMLGNMRLTDDQFRHRKNKVAQRAELVERGVWTEFVRRREAFKGSGMSAGDAWARAYEEVTNGLSGGGIGGGSDGHGVDLPRGEGDGLDAGEAEKSGAPDSAGRVSAEVFEGRTCSITRTVEWVAKHMMVDEPRAEDAPSMEAWSMLCWARRSNQNEAQFWGQIWAKMMPSKQQLEAAERLSDDGSAVLELIERVRKISEGTTNATESSD